jgi:DeoR/GlpR family transcriptional regulator of sugar metabolism
MADLADFDVIITDSAPEPAATEQLERANINLTIASNWETT